MQSADYARRKIFLMLIGSSMQCMARARPDAPWSWLLIRFSRHASRHRKRQLPSRELYVRKRTRDGKGFFGQSRRRSFRVVPNRYACVVRGSVFLWSHERPPAGMRLSWSAVGMFLSFKCWTVRSRPRCCSRPCVFVWLFHMLISCIAYSSAGLLEIWVKVIWV